MKSFDHAILAFMNQFVGHWPLFDKAVVYVSNTGFLRGGTVAALLWWAWFDRASVTRSKATRQVVIASIVAGGVSIVLARLLALTLPFRIRPINDPTSGLHFPPAPMDWEAWSAFPSDHAILFGALTTCLFFASRSLGWIAAADTVFLVWLPRLYLGIHYPTDIVAGAAIGVGVGVLAARPAIRSRLSDKALMWADKHPGSFYAFFFLLTYQLAVLFWDLRVLLRPVLKSIVE